MTTRIALLFAFVSWSGIVSAQLILNVSPPPAGPVEKGQLWNFSIANNYDHSLSVRVQFVLKSAYTGQSLLYGNSAYFTLEKGVRFLNDHEAIGITYDPVAQDFDAPYLPMGRYTACYMISSNEREDGPVSQDCFTIDVEPLSPPMLSSPADKEELELSNPSFTWLPPAPFNMFTNLQYEILVVEKKEGQSAIEALQNNAPVYSRKGLQQPVDFYPSSYSSLVPGKEYAWQVIAANGDSYSAKSEAWAFKVKKEKTFEEVLKQTPYSRIRMSNSGIAIAPNGFLKIAIVNESIDSTISIAVSTGGSSSQKYVFDAPVHGGENFIMYDLNKLFRPSENVLYECSIINSRGEKFYLLFKVHNYPVTYKKD